MEGSGSNSFAFSLPAMLGECLEEAENGPENFFDFFSFPY